MLICTTSILADCMQKWDLFWEFCLVVSCMPGFLTSVHKLNCYVEQDRMAVGDLKVELRSLQRSSCGDLNLNLVHKICVGLAMLVYFQNSSGFPCSALFVHFIEMIEVTEIVLSWQSLYAYKILQILFHWSCTSSTIVVWSCLSSTSLATWFPAPDSKLNLCADY